MDMRKLSMQGFIDEFKEVTDSYHPRRFCFILGAGASISSGIPSGEQLVDRWEDDLKKRYGPLHETWKKQNNITSENQAEHYSDYYAARFDIPSDGPAYLEKIMEKARPSGGYAALAFLLCHTANNIILTTNFDRLAEDAVIRQQKELPLVIGHETLAHYISADIKRPVIIKIHRDLLMDPKSKPEDIEKLHPNWEEHLDTVFRNYHPVFIGYAGNDKSLMEFLISKSDMFKKGVWKLPYWTIYGKEKIHGMGEKFMNAAGGYVIYECGFDELMVSLGIAKGYKLKSEEELIQEAKAERKEIEEKINKAVKEGFGKLDKPEINTKPDDSVTEGRAEDHTSEKESEKKPDLSFAAETEQLNEAANSITGDYNSNDALLRLAQVNLLMGNYSETEKLSRHLIVEEPNNSEYHRTLGMALFRKQNYDESVVEWRKCLTLAPDNAENWWALGQALAALENYPEAENAYQKAIAINPTPLYYYSLSMVLDKMGKNTEKLDSLKKLGELLN